VDEVTQGQRGNPDAIRRLAQVRPAGSTPVTARLDAAQLETLDTLITAGIAANRAEAVRWALDRIRERPAYARLRERAREIDELKEQF
jgi:Arc/MetJ-type ribon-helix-helix transcriptional regulator